MEDWTTPPCLARVRTPAEGQAVLENPSIVSRPSFVALTNGVDSDEAWEEGEGGRRVVVEEEVCPPWKQVLGGPPVFAQWLLGHTSKALPEERERLSAHKEPRHKQINPGVTPASSFPRPSLPNKSL